jgi:hypothetical protein
MKERRERGLPARSEEEGGQRSADVSSARTGQVWQEVAVEFEQSLKRHPPITPGTADPYKPPNLSQPSKENPK